MKLKQNSNRKYNRNKYTEYQILKKKKEKKNISQSKYSMIFLRLM